MTELHTLKTENQQKQSISSKIVFLQEEISQQQDRITDLEEMLRLNKEALRISLNLSVKSVQKPDKSMDQIESPKEKSLKSIINHLDQENVKLLKSIEKLTRERNISQSRSLISDQIAEEAQRHQFDTVSEFEQKISELIKLLNEKEKKMMEMEKIKPLIDRDGLIVQYREILSPSEQIMRLHNEVENTKNVLLKTSKDLTRLQSEKKELLSINFSLVNEINKLRITLVSPLNSLKQTETPQDGNQSALALINFHKKFLEESSSDDDQLSPINSPLPEKVQKNQKFDTTPDLKANNMKLGIKIPKLDLTQAKKIQELNAKKSTQQAMPKGDVKVFEKYQSMENELEKTKKLLQKEMCNNKLLCEENEILRRTNVQLVSTNETFTRSQQQYEEKWKKVYHALEFYKDFYHKYIDLTLSSLANRTSPLENASHRLETLEMYKEKHLTFEGLLKDPEKLINVKKKQDEEAGKLVNVSILDMKDDGYKEDKRFKNDKERYKAYLLNLAKDLYYKHPKEKIIQEIKFKRSLSNPIEYATTCQRNEFIEENKNLFENAKKEAKKIGEKQEDEEQMVYDTNYEEEKDDEQIC